MEFDGIVNCLVEYKETEHVEKAETNSGIYDEQIIIIYYITDDVIDENLLKFYLKQHLPSYMVPNYFIKINEIPLNKNGKVDYSGLPDYKELLCKKHIEARTKPKKWLSKYGKILLMSII